MTFIYCAQKMFQSANIEDYVCVYDSQILLHRSGEIRVVPAGKYYSHSWKSGIPGNVHAGKNITKSSHWHILKYLWKQANNPANKHGCCFPQSMRQICTKTFSKIT